MRKGQCPACEAFLRRLEPYCTAACARFLRRRYGEDAVWYMAGPGREAGESVSSVLIRSNQSLLPVFDGQRAFSVPRFLRFSSGSSPLHAIQGLREDAELVEEAIRSQCVPKDRIDYDLMILDAGPEHEALNGRLRTLLLRGPSGLSFRHPGVSDMEELFPLQAAYEREEVLPKGAVFSPPSARMSLEHAIVRVHILIAELDGRIVAKINTNAVSFTRYQLGGVYVHPDYRGHGIATAMTAAMVLEFAAGGMGMTLFVKKHNAAARTVYQRLGFRTIGDYRISYY
jgi:GNAT superfamily N-acetyltransferase